MRKIREVLRLTHELGLSVREVREATGVGKTAVCEYVNRAKVIGITWPIPPEIGDAELERLSGCPPEHLEFHIWYLKHKKWVATGEDGLLAITIDGVDRAAHLYKEGARLITDQS